MDEHAWGNKVREDRAVGKARECVLLVPLRMRGEGEAECRRQRR